MNTLQILTVLSTLVALLVTPGKGQTGVCNAATKHACVGRNLIKECVVDGTGQLVVTDSVSSCQDFASAGTVCYGAVDDFAEVCGTPPPACTAIGNFRIEGRCRNFYTCFSTGLSFIQFINECETGYEFNNATKQCSSINTAGCSVPAAPTTQSPLTTVTLAPSTTANPNPSTTANPNPSTTANPNPSTTANPNPSTTANPNLSTTPVSVTTSIPGSTTTKVVTTTQPPCPALRRLHDPTSCRHFYQCFFFGRRTRQRCPGNLVFDTTSGFCRRSTNCGTRPVV